MQYHKYAATILLLLVVNGCGGRDEYNWREIAKQSHARPVYPLAVSDNKRYLIDHEGKPFMIHGDAAWSLISGLTKPEAEIYLEDRRRKGFNTIIVNLIERKFNGPINRAGDHPFIKQSDFDTPNEKYFDHADWVLRKAAEKGIVVLLAPCYLGYEGQDEGWFNEVLANGVEKCSRYAGVVAKRYKDLDNIVWMLAGDRKPGPAMPHVEAMAAAIQKEDGRHLLTAHFAPETSTRDLFSGESWASFNLTYTYGLVHAMVMRDYYRSPPMPTVLVESTYEGEHGSEPLWIRRQAYWAMLNGAAGHVMGNRPIWLFDKGWREALDSPANQSMVHLTALFFSRPWHQLVPDFSLVTEGYGNPRGLDFVAAARTTDGTSALIYLPTARRITVDLSTMQGQQVEAWWFDPRTGRQASSGSYHTTTRHSFRPPGEGDWILGFDVSASIRN